jgi:hypothetical protein
LIARLIQQIYEADAQDQINQGFKDDCLSKMDFILHYCIRTYLNLRGTRYYITNLSKGAMKVAAAGEGRLERYNRWYDLLLREMDLVCSQQAKVIAVGRSVNDFLEMKKFERKTGRELYHILHFSNQAAKYRR